MEPCSCIHKLDYNVCKYMCKVQFWNWTLHPLDFIRIAVHFECKYCLGDRSFTGILGSNGDFNVRRT